MARADRLSYSGRRCLSAVSCASAASTRHAAGSCRSCSTHRACSSTTRRRRVSRCRLAWRSRRLSTRLSAAAPVHLRASRPRAADSRREACPPVTRRPARLLLRRTRRRWRRRRRRSRRRRGRSPAPCASSRCTSPRAARCACASPCGGASSRACTRIAAAAWRRSRRVLLRLPHVYCVLLSTSLWHQAVADLKRAVDAGDDVALPAAAQVSLPGVRWLPCHTGCVPPSMHRVLTPRVPSLTRIPAQAACDDAETEALHARISEELRVRAADA